MRKMKLHIPAGGFAGVQQFGVGAGGQTLLQGNVSETLDSWIMNTERHVVPVADVMP
jgi:hypothetical protein